MLNGFDSILARATAPSSDWRRKNFVGLFESLESRRLLSAAPVMAPLSQMQPMTSGTSFSGYTPAQIASAYSFSKITLPSGTKAGAGQTIAIIDAYSDPNITSDLATFDSKYSLAAPPSFKIVSQTGTTTLPAANASWGVEITLDVEWAHAMAPGANILLVEAKSAGDSDLLAAVNYARSTAGVSVVSMSWGGADYSGETSYDSDFTTPSGHVPVTFIAASGDGGSAAGPDWPADSPNVMSVGGTTITINTSNAYVSEVGWANSTGGVSTQETEPTYQKSAQSTGKRTEPDVSYDANTSSGFAIYDSLASGGLSGWYIAGGTSAGAPQWASLIAIADQLRVAGGKTTLDGPSVTLPTLYAAYSSSTTYAADFHDVTSGSSSSTISAKVGYDQVTGIGTPIASALVQTLVGGSATASAVTKSAATLPVIAAGKFSRHAVISGFGADAVAAAAPIAVTSSLPSPGSLILDSAGSISAVYALPGAVFAPASGFTGSTMITSSGPAMAIDDPAALDLPTMADQDQPVIPDPTSTDAPLDANHPYSHITELVPTVDDSSTGSTTAAIADDVHSSAILKAAAAIGLTALLVTMARSQARARSGAIGEQKPLADLETPWL